MLLNRYRFKNQKQQYVISLLKFSLSCELEKFTGIVCSSLLKRKVYGQLTRPDLYRGKSFPTYIRTYYGLGGFNWLAVCGINTSTNKVKVRHAAHTMNGVQEFAVKRRHKLKKNVCLMSNKFDIYARALYW